MNFTTSESVGSSHFAVNSITDQSEQTLAWGAPVEAVSFSSVSHGESFRQDSPTLTIPTKIEEWTPKLDRRFNKLAGLFSTGQISQGELQELRTLQNAREELLSPVNIEDMRRFLRRRAMVEELSATLSRYAKWEESENSAPSKTGAEIHKKKLPTGNPLTRRRV